MIVNRLRSINTNSHLARLQTAELTSDSVMHTIHIIQQFNSIDIKPTFVNGICWKRNYAQWRMCSVPRLVTIRN